MATRTGEGSGMIDLHQPRMCGGCDATAHLTAVGKRRLLLCPECAWWAAEGLNGWRRKLGRPDLGTPQLDDIVRERRLGGTR